ncbi:hypothetical protein D9757_013035 [Collybiopsis confluens]|uniref:non-specific serine/threonine protein kinase n=1 Tax=Collybiopsis confluens TaxID=2823264 RepID=A0A8H5G5G8_9AGAR|nr:hypothetical protein D9757_013035 [Collybiopsis confluens]
MVRRSINLFEGDDDFIRMLLQAAMTIRLVNKTRQYIDPDAEELVLPCLYIDGTWQKATLFVLFQSGAQDLQILFTQDEMNLTTATGAITLIKSLYNILSLVTRDSSTLDMHLKLQQAFNSLDHFPTSGSVTSMKRKASAQGGRDNKRPRLESSRSGGGQDANSAATDIADGNKSSFGDDQDSDGWNDEDFDDGGSIDTATDSADLEAEIECNGFRLDDQACSSLPAWGENWGVRAGFSLRDGSGVVIKRVRRSQERKIHQYMANLKFADAVVLPILAVLSLERSTYLVFPRWPESLEEFITSGGLQHVYSEDCIEITLALASGLAFLHKHHIAHLDIKPANLVVDKDASPVALRIIDFSAAVHVPDELTMISIYAGTQGYMAPEVSTMSRYLPYKADLFSCGQVFLDIANGWDRDGMIQNFGDQLTQVDPQARPDLTTWLQLGGTASWRMVRALIIWFSMDGHILRRNFNNMLNSYIQSIQFHILDHTSTSRSVRYSRINTSTAYAHPLSRRMKLRWKAFSYRRPMALFDFLDINDMAYYYSNRLKPGKALHVSSSQNSSGPGPDPSQTVLTAHPQHNGSPSTAALLKNLLEKLPQNNEETMSYFTTLLKASSQEQGTPSNHVLNGDENNFLRELDQALEPPQLPNNGKIIQGEEDDDEELTEEDESLGTMDDDGQEPNNMLPVKDITKRGKRRSSRRRQGGKKPKVLLKEFDNDDLPLLAKRCARMGTCIINMFPDNKLFAWALFSDKLREMAAEGAADDMVRYLKEISSNSNKRKDLVTFMSYGPSSIRFDIGKESSAVSWLMANRRYHEGDVNIAAHTTNGLPFQTSLIGGILRGYFIDGKPSQDELLIAHLKSQQTIPLSLIAMIVTLIGNAIQEYAIGYKQPIVKKLIHVWSYTAIVKTLKDIEMKTPAYYSLMQARLWKEMKLYNAYGLESQHGRSRDCPPQVYNYDALTAYALSAEIDHNQVGERTAKEVGFPEGQGKERQERRWEREKEEEEEEEEEEENTNSSVAGKVKLRSKTLSEELAGEPTLILDGIPNLV